MKEITDVGDYEKIKKDAFSLVRVSLQHASKNSPFYKKMFSSEGISAEKIRTYDDFKNLPFTTPEDLKKHNFDFLALPLSEIWQVFSTTGTTGEPKFYFYDRKRIQSLLGSVTECVLKRVGLRLEGLIAAVFFPLDVLSGGGPIAVRTCESLGIPVVGFGISPPAELVAGRLNKIKPNWFYIFPSTFLKLVKELKEMKFDPKGVDVQVMFSSGEPLNESTRKEIQKFFKPKEIVDILASVDMSAYIASECKEHDGLHLLPFSIFPEVVDLETGKLIEEGVGELVLSSIQSYGNPILRYRSGDIVRISGKKCACGRNIPRVWVLGRTDDRVIIQGGRKFFVSVEINEFIKQFPVLTQNYQFIIEERGRKDSITLRIESKSRNKKLVRKISAELVKFSNPLSLAFADNRLFEPVIELLPLHSLERFRGKIKNRIIDKRKWSKYSV